MRTLGTTYTLGALTCLTLALANSASGAGLRVIVENRAPENGTWLTPMWIAFHDGTFDTHDLLAPASAELERLAEDGNLDPIGNAFVLSGTGQVDGAVVSPMGIPPLAPGETASIMVVVDETTPSGRYFSYGSMVIPSNDAFIANDEPSAHRIFDQHCRPAAGASWTTPTSSPPTSPCPVTRWPVSPSSEPIRRCLPARSRGRGIWTGRPTFWRVT
jgi:hypothetical protein